MADSQAYPLPVDDTTTTVNPNMTANSTITELPEKRIYFADVQKHLPESLPKNCVSYKAGCNSCGISFYNGIFEWYSCTEIGCPAELYECMYEHENDYYTIPPLPDTIVFPDGYTLWDSCAVIISSDEGKYYSLEYSFAGFEWNSDLTNVSYQNKGILWNTDFTDFIWGKSICVRDINGKLLLEHPENAEILSEFEDFIQEKETQAKQDTQVCLISHKDCKWMGFYYRPENSSPASRYGGLKTYSNNIPNCTDTISTEVCKLEISELDLEKKQTEFKATALNTEGILRNRSICFDRIWEIESSCVRYESECETCEVLLDPRKLTWRWDFQSKWCTQKYIKEQDGLPNMECASYQK